MSERPDNAVDILVVLYNSSRFIGPLLDSLSDIRLPVTCYFLDNASTDNTVDVVEKRLPQLPHPAYLLRSRHNNGFARGMNLLARQSTAGLMFLLNPDTVLRPECLETLVDRMMSDPAVAVCEARQSPREHPKAFDAETGETSWCTGAAVVIRRCAFEEVGGFDEHAFFMYCEDIDLSWKFWLRGWKCIYVPEAVIEHYTQDILPGKRRTLENYFVFRNSIFLFYRFGSWRDRGVLWDFFLNRFVRKPYSFRSKALYVFAFVDHIRYIPYLLRTRNPWCAASHHWIRFRETSLAD